MIEVETDQLAGRGIAAEDLGIGQQVVDRCSVDAPGDWIDFGNNAWRNRGGLAWRSADWLARFNDVIPLRNAFP